MSACQVAAISALALAVWLALITAALFSILRQGRNGRKP